MQRNILTFVAILCVVVVCVSTLPYWGKSPVEVTPTFSVNSTVNVSTIAPTALPTGMPVLSLSEAEKLVDEDFPISESTPEQVITAETMILESTEVVTPEATPESLENPVCRITRYGVYRRFITVETDGYVDDVLEIRAYVQMNNEMFVYSLNFAESRVLDTLQAGAWTSDNESASYAYGQQMYAGSIEQSVPLNFGYRPVFIVWVPVETQDRLDIQWSDWVTGASLPLPSCVQ